MHKFFLFFKLGLFCGLLVLCGFGYTFYKRQFRLENIRLNHFEENTLLENLQNNNAIHEIIAQPFHYLDRGRQSFVFGSQDGRYVLKFLDTHLFNFKKTDLIEKKMTRLIEGYRLAYTFDREHTGLIFVQLAPTKLKHLPIALFDRFGFRHAIDLAHVPFIIQKKANPTRRVLSAYLRQGNVDAAKQHLRLIIDMYMDEYQKGLYDRDHNFMYNTGFIEGQPIRIDVGRLAADNAIKQPENFSKDLKKIAIDRTGGWMQRHFPVYREEILTDMQLKLHELGIN